MVSGSSPGQERRGVPVAAAARALGLSYEALRKRIKRGTVPAYKVDGHWYVMLETDPAAVPDNRTVDVPGHVRVAVPDTVPDRGVAPAEIERAINSTTDRYARHLDNIRESLERAYQGQLAAKDAELGQVVAVIAAKDETIAELRRRAEAAEAEISSRNEKEAERDRLAAAQAAQDGSGATEGVSAGSPTPEPSAGFWVRVRRFFGKDE